MKYKFEFNHDERHFDKAFPSTLNPEEAMRDINKLQKGEVELRKTEAIEKILIKLDPQTPNDIFVLGLAFGTAHSLEKLIESVRHGLPSPQLMQVMLDTLMEAAYGEGSYGLNKEEFNKHIKEKKNDF